MLPAFDFNDYYRPGLKNKVPGAFSRWINETPESEEEGDQLQFLGDDSVLIITKEMVNSAQGDKVQI